MEFLSAIKGMTVDELKDSLTQRTRSLLLRWRFSEFIERLEIQIITTSKKLRKIGVQKRRE
jgi:hypothetical protein